MATVTLGISGMACGGCVQSITNVLKALAGVEKADVSLDTRTATVVYDSDKVDVDRLKRSIIDAGYEIAP